jgi:hypothetical protein
MSVKYNVTNQETGETYELTDDDLSFEPKDSDIAILDSTDTALDFMRGKTPYHIQMLMKKSDKEMLSPEDAEYELNCFTGVPSRDFSDYIGMKVRVLGAAIIPHGPYHSKLDPQGPLQPGYLRCLFLIDELDKQEDNIVLECSGTNIFDHTINMLAQYGWYIWDSPREYSIRRGGKSNAYYMKSTHKPNKKKVVVES